MKRIIFALALVVFSVSVVEAKPLKRYPYVEKWVGFEPGLNYLIEFTKSGRCNIVFSERSKIQAYPNLPYRMRGNTALVDFSNDLAMRWFGPTSGYKSATFTWAITPDDPKDLVAGLTGRDSLTFRMINGKTTDSNGKTTYQRSEGHKYYATSRRGTEIGFAHAPRNSGDTTTLKEYLKLWDDAAKPMVRALQKSPHPTNEATSH